MGIEIKPREQCPQCAAEGRDTAKDNLAVYADGKFCQAGCGYIEKNNKEEKFSDLIAGSIVELADRKLSLQTCEKYNVRTTEFTGSLAGQELNKDLIRIFPIYKNGKVVKQKIKSVRDKSIQAQRGDTKYNGLFGQSSFSPTEKLGIVITEGEEDAMAAYQMSGLPAISITGGATGSEKQLLENIEWLSGWREIYLCMDNDDKGREAVEKYSSIFEPGKVKNVILPLKDANEMLKAERGEEFKKLLWSAEIIKPSTIVFPNELREKILSPPPYGAPWPWEFMTKVTYGNRKGEVYIIGAAPSIGKTQIVYQIITQHTGDGLKVGLFDLERQPEQTMQRMISGLISKKIYLPNCPNFDKKEVNDYIDLLADRVALYRPSSGKLTIDTILINIRYLNKAYGMGFFVIDNLTALGADVYTKQHEFAAYAIGKFVQVARELNVTIFIINHLTKSHVALNADITMPDDYEYNTNKKGLTWDTGRIPLMDDLYGGMRGCALADYVISCARNRMSSDDEEKRTIHVKFLKTRFESEFEGHVFKVIYDRETGQLREVY